MRSGRRRAVAGAVASQQLATVYQELIEALAPSWWWRADEASGSTATDEVGAANGTIQNTADVTYSQPPLVAGDAGASMTFGGTNGHVTRSNPVQSANFTIDLALRLDANTAKHLIATTGGSAAGDFSLEIVTDGQLRAWSRDDAGSAIIFTGSAADVPFSTPFKLTYVRLSDAVDGGQFIYVDGVLTAFSTATKVWSAHPSATWRIGIWPVGPTAPLQGGIDEVAIWNRALSAAEIQSIALPT